MKTNRRNFVRGASAVAVLGGVNTTSAEKKYSDGASDTEVRIGHTGPYSGPASSYGVIGKSIEAYWKMVNDKGGINGRKVTFITYDDGYSPPKTVEMTRKLVEQDKVLCIFNPLGTPTSTAVHKYMNRKKVPHLFIGAGATKWGDPKHFPWTIGWQPDYQTEAAIYAKHALAEHRGEKICMLWQNDDAGKDYAEGFLKGLGKENERLVVASVSYEPTDATIDSQIIQLKNSGATVLFSHVIPKQAAQAIRKAAELGWKHMHYLANVSASVGAVMKPAGFENCQGIISSAYLKDPTDPQWASAPDFVQWKEWMEKYQPAANQADQFNVYAYAVSATMHEMLKECGDELTRENLMKHVTSMKDLEIPLLLPSIKLSTSATDYYPIQSMRLQRFKGEGWELFGDIISSEHA